MSRSELKQYLIDFESGKVLEFDIDNTELLIMKDNQLYEEYVKLSRKKKKDLMFLYVRKFNEKNPLYIPVEQKE
jgi:DNA mismatch repair ATPase MutS